jgi:hypothetical protein
MRRLHPFVWISLFLAGCAGTPRNRGPWLTLEDAEGAISAIHAGERELQSHDLDATRYKATCQRCPDERLWVVIYELKEPVGYWGGDSWCIAYVHDDGSVDLHTEFLLRAPRH